MATTPTTTEMAATLRAFVRTQRPRAWSQGYPAAVRERVQVYAAERRSAGANARMIAEELGLSRHSVRAWAWAGPGLDRLRQVVVVRDPEPLPNRSPSPPALTPARSVPVLVTPKGYRVEGLDVAALVELLVAVG